jgi:uncharacterized membrane protein
MYNISYWFIIFIIYSFIGWIIDICDIYYKYKKIVNRGFYIGPYCPIYGVGVLLIIFLLNNYTDSPLALFVLATVICMVLEYLTSYVMEKWFNARWWDYSDRKFNLNGRICLETTIPFGLGAMLVMYVVQPFIVNILNKIPNNLIIIIGIVLMTIFIIDAIISFSVITKIKDIDISKFKDDTEEINKRIKEYLKNSSPLMKRLIESFPDAKISIKKMQKRFNKSKEKLIKKMENRKNH